MPRPSAKGKLMEAAMSSFQALGFKGCTIEDIAKKAGVFKGSFYNHFESKEALAVEAVKLFISEGLKTLPLQGPPSPLARLKAHFKTLMVFMSGDHLEDGCLLAKFSSEASDESAALRDALEEQVNQWCKTLGKVIKQAQTEGEISTRHKPELLARFVINAWEGATVRMRVLQRRQPLADFFKVVFEDILAPEK